MSKEWILISEKVIRSVEETLQSAYLENNDIHNNLNGEEPIKIPSLIPERAPYSYERSEALFWIDRDTYYEEMEFCLLKHHESAIEFIKQNDLKPVFLDLVASIKRKRIVPFIGAGISCSSNYPLWGKALHEISERIDGLDVLKIEEQLLACEYFEVAQILWNAENAQVKSYIRNKFSDGQMPMEGPVGAVNFLPELCDGCIVTTNFDGMIEKVIGKGHITGYMHGLQEGNKFSTKLVQGERCLLKLHGDAEDHETYVFTAEQYDKAYGNPLDFTKPLSKALRQIYVTSSLLFLGCSMSHDKTLELFSEVILDSDFDVPDHFSLLPQPNDGETKNQKEARLNELKIRTLWYPDDDHSYVEKYLALALDMASERLRDF
ncbi:SIR2 family protein [Marinicella sediminis]|uniref:SIR2 family protein n=1 Tax=Marinicella sediminis TaxID=1792834 RepID=A0ABV7JD91_9GAMM|nr:SIR2 family protein [Marinicella sediminis]